MQKGYALPATKNSSGNQRFKHARGVVKKGPTTQKGYAMDVTTLFFILTKTKNGTIEIATI